MRRHVRQAIAAASLMSSTQAAQQHRTSTPGAGSSLPLRLLVGPCPPVTPLSSRPLPGVADWGPSAGAHTLSGTAGAAKLCGSAASARAAAAAAAGLSLLQRGEPAVALVGEPGHGPAAGAGIAADADADADGDAAGRVWLLGSAGGGLVRMTGITRPGGSWPLLTPWGASLLCRWGRGEPSSRRLVRRRQASVALTATYTAARDRRAGEKQRQSANAAAAATGCHCSCQSCVHVLDLNTWTALALQAASTAQWRHEQIGKAAPNTGRQARAVERWSNRLTHEGARGHRARHQGRHK